MIKMPPPRIIPCFITKVYHACPHIVAVRSRYEHLPHLDDYILNSGDIYRNCDAKITIKAGKRLLLAAGSGRVRLVSLPNNQQVVVCLDQIPTHNQRHLRSEVAARLVETPLQMLEQRVDLVVSANLLTISQLQVLARSDHLANQINNPNSNRRALVPLVRHSSSSSSNHKHRLVVVCSVVVRLAKTTKTNRSHLLHSVRTSQSPTYNSALTFVS